MSMREGAISLDVGKNLLLMIDQRAKQQGISRSEYVREAIYLEFLFSGDLEATKFVFKRVGQRVKDAIADKLRDTDVKEQVKILAGQT